MKIALALPLVLALAGCAASADDRDPRIVKSGYGRTSWYHEGSRVATGERYNPDGLTTAHRTLPFGSHVRITNQHNGRSVVVRVNDRGPAKWTGRDWDVSRGAARHLDMIQAGVVPVKWELIE